MNIVHTYPPMKMDQTECSETSAYKIQTPGNYPEESIQHSEHGEMYEITNKCKYFRKCSSFVRKLYGGRTILVYNRT